MPHTPDNIITELKQNKYAPVYFLQGEEPYFIDVISDYIENNALSETERGFNQVVLYGKDTDMSTIISNAKKYPMMSDRQVVIVKEAQELRDLQKNIKEKVGGKEIEFNLLEEYVKNPLPSTILVFCHKYKSLDGRKSLAKTIDKHGILVNSAKMYDNKLPAWISALVASKGYKINTKASVLLAEYLGNDLSKISNELEKLAISIKQGSEIDENVISNNIGISKEYNIFELQASLGTKDVLKANRIINYFASNPKENNVISVVTALYSYFSKIILAHCSPEKSDNGMASFIEVNPYFVKDYKLAAQNYTLEKLYQIISHLKVADLQKKGVLADNADDGEIMKELIFKILH
jgi:DNA polymerase III subunit delta